METNPAVAAPHSAAQTDPRVTVGATSARPLQKIEPASSMHGPRSAVPSAVRTGLVIVVAWRIVLAVTGVIAHSILPRGRFTSFSLLRHEHWSANPLTLALDACVRNDALWYASIVQHGYSYSTRHTSSIAFYPLYPLLTKIVSLMVGNVYVAGVLVSTVCMLLLAPLLYLWLTQQRRSDRITISLLALLCFPGAIFLAVMYSEALYLVLALALFLFYERQQWLLAAACAFLIALSRPTGILVLPALLVLLIQAGRVRDIRAWLPVAAGPFALTLFSLYQYFAFGTPFASVRAAQVSPWSRGLHQALLDVTLHSRPGFPSWYFATMLVIGLLILAITPLVYRQFGAAYALFAALSVLGPAASGLISLERYVAVDFPVFAALSCTLGAKARRGLLLGSFYFLIFSAAAFAAGWAVF